MYWGDYRHDKFSAKNFELVMSKNRRIEKFNADEITYQLKIKNIVLNEIMESLIRQLLIHTKPLDKVKIYINHPVLTENMQFKFAQACDLSAETIINTIAKLAQSG